MNPCFCKSRSCQPALTKVEFVNRGCTWPVLSVTMVESGDSGRALALLGELEGTRGRTFYSVKKARCRGAICGHRSVKPAQTAGAAPRTTPQRANSLHNDYAAPRG